MKGKEANELRCGGGKENKKGSNSQFTWEVISGWHESWIIRLWRSDLDYIKLFNQHPHRPFANFHRAGLGYPFPMRRFDGWHGWNRLLLWAKL